MSKATVEIGGKSVELDKTIERARAGLRSLAKTAQDESRKVQAAVNGASGGAGGKGRNLAGQASLQVQDIAVQLQGGTSALTVFAQQGSQLASIFGPTGAIVGGLAAIGGAVLMMGSKANESFENMRKDALAFGAELAGSVASGSVPQIIAGLEKSQTQMAALKKEASETAGVYGSIASAMGMLMGGKSVTDKLTANAQDQSDLYWQQVGAIQEMLKLSEQDVQIARLKADGKKEEAEQMERQRDLAFQLAKIESSNLPRSTKAYLADDARAKSQAAADGAEREKMEKAKKQGADLVESIEADERAALDKRIDKEKKRKADLIDFEKKQKEQFLQWEEKRQKELSDAALAQAQREGQERDRASKAMQAADADAEKIAESKLTLSEKISRTANKIAEAEDRVKRAAKGSVEEYEALAGLQNLRNQQAQQLADMARNFEGGTMEAQRSIREEKKRQKERERGEKRAEDEAVRRADREARRNDPTNGKGNNGLTDAQKDAIRQDFRKNLGKDKQGDLQKEANRTLKDIQKHMQTVAETVAVK